MPFFRESLWLAHSDNEEGINDYVDSGLERSNAERAEAVALTLRDKIGIYKFGEMWAETKIALPHDRKIWLQSSDRSLVINMHSRNHTDHKNVGVHWDRLNQHINTYEVWGRNKYQPVLFYQVSQRQNFIPESLTPWHISRNFSVLLGVIEQSINIASETPATFPNPQAE